MNENKNYKKLINNLDKNKNCYDYKNDSFNLFNMSLYTIQTKYLSIQVIFLSIIAYLFDLKQLFYVLYPLLWICGIIGTILIISRWHKTGFYFLNLNCFKENSTLKDEIIDFLNENYTTTFIFIRFWGIIIHFIPIIYFIYFTPLIKEYKSFKAVNNILIFFINLGIITSYGLITKFEMYGEIKDKTSMLIYTLLFTYIFSIYLLPL